MAELDIRTRGISLAFMAAIDDVTDSLASVAPDDIDNLTTGTIRVDVGDNIVELLTSIITVAAEHGVVIDSVDELITAADIAERRKLTRSSITRYIHGDRGRGNFPAPINPGARHELYRWLEVQAWFDQAPALVNIAAVDLAVRLRQQLCGASADIRHLCVNVLLAP